MSGKKVGGLARPDFKTKEKASVPESPKVPIKDDYGSPAYQDPGLCAGTGGVSFLSSFRLILANV